MRSILMDMCFPRCCGVCGKVLVPQEDVLCLPCLHDLPRTYQWLVPDNPLAGTFKGRIPFDRASSFLFFREASPYRKLLHLFKYGGELRIGLYMGSLFGKELVRTWGLSAAPIIIPVPMSSFKRKKRGYNQAEWLAAGIAMAAGWPLDTSAVDRIRERTSQTVYDREKRRENIKNAFVARSVPYSEVLLVDDVVTTGATMESCALAILDRNPAIRLSLASLAYVE
jgi:ComF family protein